MEKKSWAVLENGEVISFTDKNINEKLSGKMLQIISVSEQYIGTQKELKEFLFPSDWSSKDAASMNN